MAEPNSVCGHCVEDATVICSGCSAIKYCSVECQQADWQWHKHLCKEFTSFKTRPNVNSRLAIYLPEKDSKPRFVWIEVQPEESDNELPLDEYDEVRDVPVWDRESGYGMSDFEGLLGDHPASSVLVCGKLGSGERLDHSIHISCLDSFLHLPPNHCLYKLIGSGLGDHFRGPLVLHGMTKVANPHFVTDLHPSDFTFALKGLIVAIEKMKESFSYFMEPRAPNKVKGVKLTPGGTFEDLDVPLMHPIFETGKPSEISKKFTFTLLTWQSKSNAVAPEGTSAIIPPTAYLHLDINNAPAKRGPGAKTFGSLSEEWNDSTKTILIVQENKRDVSSTTVEMACRFCRDVIEPLLKDRLRKNAKPVVPSFSELEEMWVEFVKGSVKA